MFKLSEIKDYSLEKIRDISQQLNTADEYPENKLDCSNVYGLEDDVLEALFSAIRDDWMQEDGRELDKFMLDINRDLLAEIKVFLRNKLRLKNIENKVSNNFKFLTKPDLLKLATLAEKYYLTDPETSLIKCRQFAELCAKYVSAKVGLYEEAQDLKLITLLKKLRNRNVFNQKIFLLFNDIRNAGNSVVHLEPAHLTDLSLEVDNSVDRSFVINVIIKVHELAKWFHSAFCTREVVIFDDYIIPSHSYSNSQPTLEDDFNSDISTTLEAELSNIHHQTILDPDGIKSDINRGFELGNKTIFGGIFMRNEELEKGLIIGSRYQIVEKLSQGSFGTTYLAEDLHIPDKPLVVVKQFTPNKSDEGTFSKAKHLFDQEAKILQKLSHHSDIPTLFAFFEEDDKLFLVQEYIEGNTLRQEFKGKDQPYTEEEVITLIKDILTPLCIVHDSVIVHRDLKPENLIRRVSDEKIVIIDFGAIKQIIEDNNNPGTIIGTRGYMPPEQWEGSSISYSCDVYAVGIIAIEALTGSKINDSFLRQEKLKESNINEKLKEILLKMTEFDPRNRYISAKEALDAIHTWEKESDETPTIIEDPPLPPPPPPKLFPLWLKITIGVGILAGVALFIKSFPYLTKTKLQQTELTIGTLWTPEDLQGLIEYIEDNSVPANYFDFLKGEKVKVLANGDRTLAYTEAKKRIENKEWDIAFTTSPILSIFAKDQNYSYLAGMFPGSVNYQSGFFVNANSPIQSLNDINANTIVGLGGFNSASSFYMPVYDLYGKTITANTGNRGSAIVELVREGKVDVGAAAIGDSVRKDDPNFRIIHVSRDIPGSGVYASPSLSSQDRDQIQKLMLSVPVEEQKKANYGEQKESDYTEFRKIVQRVEEILVCADFTQNPVTLACTDDIKTIQGKINGVSIEGDNFILKLSADGQIYDILISVSMTTEVFGSDKLTDIQGRSVEIQTSKIGDDNQISVRQATQIKLN